MYAQVCPRLAQQLQAIIFDPQRLVDLKLELAVTVNIGEPFVKATYFLEGDGPLVLACYEKLIAISLYCQGPHFPNVRAIATAIAKEDHAQNVAVLEQREKACVEQ